MQRSPIFLASKSPRRRELLSGLGYEVCVLADTTAHRGYFPGDEEVLANESPEAYVFRTARDKFEEGLELRARLYPQAEFDRCPIVAADTVVSLDGEILGKPKDAEEAVRFLECLSGRTHEVRTCVWAGTQSERRHAVSLSFVSFRTLSRAETMGYVATGEPFDKAGGYGIQGLAGVFIERIEGSFTGIMGLPVCETTALLAVLGAPVPALATLGGQAAGGRC